MLKIVVLWSIISNERGDCLSAVKNSEQIYIVVSQTGTVLSRLLKLITHDEYNHVSIALKRDLALMYSFGRRNPYFPFPGGFVVESWRFGTFKRFVNTKVVVLALDVDSDDYSKIKSYIHKMVVSPKKYRYNYIGLCLAAFEISYRGQNSFYCSEFVKQVLDVGDVGIASNFSKVMRPEDFLSLPNADCIYKGNLKDYSKCFEGE